MNANHEVAIDKRDLRGETKCFIISDKMIDDERNFDSWDHCEGVFSDMELDDDIISDVNQGSYIIVEGMLPEQQSDLGRYAPKVDMANFMVNATFNAIKQHEAEMLSYKQHIQSVDGVDCIDMISYIKDVLGSVLRASIKDNAAIINLDITTYGINKLMEQVTINYSAINTGFGTLDYFKRLDAITNAYDYDFWLKQVDIAHARTVAIIEAKLLDIAGSMAMSELFCDDRRKMIIKPIDLTDSRYQAVNDYIASKSNPD